MATTQLPDDTNAALRPPRAQAAHNSGAVEQNDDR